MGQPVKIMDLAKQFIKLSGREDIKIKIIGLRVGEKLYEELLISESDIETSYDEIFVGKKTFYNIEKLSKDIDSLVKSTKQIEELRKILPEFEHRLNG